MKCVKCGAELPDIAQFCFMCGKSNIPRSVRTLRDAAPHEIPSNSDFRLPGRDHRHGAEGNVEILLRKGAI